MQSNMYDDEHQSIFVFRNPLRFLSRKGRQIGAYLSGGLVRNSNSLESILAKVTNYRDFDTSLACYWLVGVYRCRY